MNTARCSFCNKHIDVASMGVSALESHSNGKKHKTNTSWLIQKLQYVFGKSSASSTEAEKSVENSSSENTCKNNSTLDNIIAINNSSLNAEIIWCLKVVNAHWSYNSSSNIAKLFQCMFPADSEKASLILKVDWEKRLIHQFIVPCLLMKLWILLSKSIKWMLMSDFGMDVEISSRLDIRIQDFWIELMLRIFLRVLKMHLMGCDEKTSCN